MGEKLSLEEKEKRTKELARRYYQANKERLLAANKKYYAEHPEKAKEYREYRKKHYHDKILAAQKAYYERNKEILAEKARAWRKAHPEKMKEYNRRAAERRAAGKISGCSTKYNHSPDIDKAVALFKDPAKANHLRWLVENNLNKNINP